MPTEPAVVDPQRLAVPVPRAAVEAFCRRWDVTELSLFGSVLRDDFRPADSDVDVMVTFAAPNERTLGDLEEMREELETLFGRPVDLLTRPGVESMVNWYRRRAILNSARVVYAR